MGKSWNDVDISGGIGQDLWDIEVEAGGGLMDVACSGAYICGWGGWVDVGAVCSLNEIDTTGTGVIYSGIPDSERGCGGTC